MPEKVSLRRGDRKKKAPKYKNSFAFKHNKNSRYTKKIANIDTKSGTCRKCRDIIEWRKKYRKYKPVKDPKTCAWCQQKNVKLAYHVVCHGCAYDKKVCPKCLLEKTVIEEEFGFSEESITEFLKNKPITERQRRMLLRKWDNEEITGAQVKMAIERLTEGKNTKIVVQVQSGDDDFEDDDEGDKDVDADNDDADNKNNATDSEVGDAKECATGDNAVVAEEKSADSTQQKDDEKDQ